MPDTPIFKSDFLRTFAARGAYYACTEPAALDALLQNERVTAYIGFDCTAPSLHVGHALQAMTLRRLQQAGHKPIVVIGGGTTKVGDPSFRNEARPLLSYEQSETNKAAYLMASSDMFSETGYRGVGFGLGVAMMQDLTHAALPGSIGEYTWGGLAGTFFFVDPAEDMIMVFMTQVIDNQVRRTRLRRHVRALVYSAIEESYA